MASFSYKILESFIDKQDRCLELIYIYNGESQEILFAVIYPQTHIVHIFDSFEDMMNNEDGMYYTDMTKELDYRNPDTFVAWLNDTFGY
jgi:hypothetical protein